MLLLCGSAIALLRSNKVQNYLVQIVVSNFSSKIGSKVQIASVDYALFNKVLLEDVYIEDKNGDSLLFVKELRMGFSPLKLFQNEIVCNYIEVNRLSGNIIKDENDKLNLQFILDALKKDNKKSTLNYQLEGIKITNSRLTYHNLNSSYCQEHFDKNNISLFQLNAEIDLHKFNKKELNAKVKSISFIERSGFTLKDFTASIIADKEKALIKGLTILLPKSEIYFTPITANYKNLSNLKKLNTKVQFDFLLEPSQIALSDLKGFLPALKHNREKIKLSTHFTGSIGNIKIKNLNLSYNNDIYVRGDLNFNGLPNIEETFIHTQIKSIKTNKHKLQDFLSSVIGRPFQLPEKFSNLGTINYKGAISGFFSDLVVYGSLKTKSGEIFTDVLMGISSDFTGMKYSGSLHANDFKLGSIMKDETSAGDASFSFSSTGSIYSKGRVNGIIEGEISSIILKDYMYKNILLKGGFDKKTFDGWIKLDDQFAKLDFNGKLDFSERLPSGNFKMSVKRLNLQKLNLIKTHPNLTLAFNINTSFTGSKIEETDTEILIDSLYIANNDKEVFSENIYIQSNINDSLSVLAINSNLITGSVKGQYSFLSFGRSFTNIVESYLPSLKNKTRKNKKKLKNNFVFYLTDFHIDKFTDILEYDLTLSPKSLISGFYNEEENKFRLEVIIPRLKKGRNSFKDLNFLCNNEFDALNITSSSEINKKTKFNFFTRVANDSILLDFDWRNPHNFSGKLNTSAFLYRNEKENLHANIDILPSKVWLKDSLWNIHQSQMNTNFKTLEVSELVLDHNDQFIKIDGTASKSTNDSLYVKLNDVLLGNIMDMAKVRTPKIEGLVTGDCYVMSVFDKMILELDVFAEDFTFNNSIWGDAKMKSVWDDSEKKLHAKGFAYTADKDTAFNIEGEYYPQNDSMEFLANINKLGVDFLRYYLDGALNNVSGDASGKLRIFGGIRHFELEGDLFVKNGYFDVDIMKTAYHFNDTIYVKKDAVFFDDITIYDYKNNTGLLNGNLTHKNYKNMRYRFDIKSNNVLAMKTTKEDNENFYGTAFGTGKIRIAGTKEEVNFNINMKTEPDTKLVIPMVTTEIATENSFIQFVNKKKTTKEKDAEKKKKENSLPDKTKVHVSLQLEATPDGQIKLITDPIGGDYVQVEGYGNLKIEYDNIDGNKLYGTYEVERGDYLFTLQQVIKKNFTVKPGGTIRWSGDPYEAIIDLNATYTVPSVSLLDILEDTQDLARTSLPVNCLLNLTGNLMQPTIKFDLELPSVPELQSRIKNIVNTEEMMNREILALLVMSRFYKPDNLQTESTGLGTEMVSVLTTTVSGQLNNWLSKLNDKVNVGLNARLGNGQNFSEGGEYKLGVMYQPNNRLIINSNLGYREDIYNPTTTNFIGDLDVEYKLNKSGKFRAKAYTHSADNFFINAKGTALTTQGLGIMYREDFDKFSDVLKLYFKKNDKKNDSIKSK